MQNDQDTQGQHHANNMKTLYQIFIIAFIALSLFILKDDIKSLSKKFFEASPLVATTIKDATKSVNGVVNKVSPVEKSVETPGALRVPDDFINTIKGNSRLSIEGIIDFTNINRAGNGNLEPLKENKELDLSAQIKLKDMFAKQYFEHQSPSGVGVSDLASKVSYEYIMIGENLALGDFKDNEALVDAWMASPGHRANILNKRYTEIGVAAASGVFEGRNVWISVQHFGLPRNACPTIDEKLHSLINISESNIKTIEADLISRKARIDSGVVYDGFTTNEQIGQYNGIVATYNQLIADIKSKISKYNTEVRVFNDCLAG